MCPQISHLNSLRHHGYVLTALVFFACHVRTSKMLPHASCSHFWTLTNQSRAVSSKPISFFFILSNLLSSSSVQNAKKEVYFPSTHSTSPIFLLITPLAYWNLIPKKEDTQQMEEDFSIVGRMCWTPFYTSGGLAFGWLYFGSCELRIKLLTLHPQGKQNIRLVAFLFCGSSADPLPDI